MRFALPDRIILENRLVSETRRIILAQNFLDRSHQMDVQLQTQRISLPRRAAGELIRRTKRAMGHFSQHVTRLSVNLRDTNGTKNGHNDKVCTIVAELNGGGQIVVVDRSSKMGKALRNALHRARTLVARELQKRSSRRQRTRPVLRLAMESV